MENSLAAIPKTSPRPLVITWLTRAELTTTVHFRDTLYSTCPGEDLSSNQYGFHLMLISFQPFQHGGAHHFPATGGGAQVQSS